MDYHHILLHQMNSYIYQVILLVNSITVSINTIYVREPLEEEQLNNNIIPPNLNKDKLEKNIADNINNKATANKERHNKTTLPAPQDWKIPRNLVKIEEKQKMNNMSCSYANYYSTLHLYNSNIEDNDTNNEDLIKILKEID